MTRRTMPGLPGRRLHYQSRSRDPKPETMGGDRVPGRERSGGALRKAAAARELASRCSACVRREQVPAPWARTSEPLAGTPESTPSNNVDCSSRENTYHHPTRTDSPGRGVGAPTGHRHCRSAGKLKSLRARDIQDAPSRPSEKCRARVAGVPRYDRSLTTPASARAHGQRQAERIAFSCDPTGCTPRRSNAAVGRGLPASSSDLRIRSQAAMSRRPSRRRCFARHCGRAARRSQHCRVGRVGAARVPAAMRLTATPGQATARRSRSRRPSARSMPTQNVIVLARNRPPSKLGALWLSPKLSGAAPPNRASRATIAFPGERSSRRSPSRRRLWRRGDRAGPVRPAPCRTIGTSRPVRWGAGARAAASVRFRSSSTGHSTPAPSARTGGGGCNPWPVRSCPRRPSEKPGVGLRRRRLSHESDGAVRLLAPADRAAGKHLGSAARPCSVSAGPDAARSPGRRRAASPRAAPPHRAAPAAAGPRRRPRQQRWKREIPGLK